MTKGMRNRNQKPAANMIEVAISEPIGKHFGIIKNSNWKREMKKIEQWGIERSTNGGGLIPDEETRNCP